MVVFPSALFDSSILTSVLVGLLVVWALQETLGWNSTGIVVPGYIASVLVLQPTTAMVMVTEAVVVCLIVRAMTHGTPPWWPWTAPFGRDRFFLILAVSVLVRIVFEGGGLQRIGGTGQDQLHSMGLVIVPLMANALWRTGISQGALQIGVPLVVTYGVLRLVLLPLTNLDLSDFELSYEDVARDFAASPKAYILLLTGAWLGSLFNVRYGWDFGGLIVPGLLALCWLTPFTVVATLVEAIAIAGATTMALSIPWLRNSDMSGSRPLVLAFVLGFAAKFTLAIVAEGVWPGLSVRSLFGFGYLLPSIIAIRIVKHRDPFRVAVPVATVSLLAFLLGSAVGFGVDQLRRSVSDEGMGPSLPSSHHDPVVAAWWDVGQRARPAALSSVVDGWTPDGPGATWHDPEGHAFALFTEGTQDQPIISATGPLVRGLRPRLAHVCTGSPAECAATRRAVAQRHPTLVVRRGDTTEIRVRGDAPRDLPLGEVVALLPAATLVQHPGPSALLMTDADVQRLATPRCDERREPVAPLTVEARQHVLHEVLLPTLALWASAPSPHHPCLLDNVAQGAGLTWVDAGSEGELRADDWSLRLRRDAPAGLVWAPRRTDEPGTQAVASALYRTRSQAVLLVSDPPPIGAVEGADEPLALALWLVDAFGADAPVTVVRSTPDGASELLLEVFDSPLADALGPLPTVDGSAQHLSLRGAPGPLRRAAEAVSASLSTVYASAEGQAQLAPIPEAHVLWARVPKESRSWDALHQGTSMAPVPAELAWFDDAVSQAVDQGEPGYLTLLQEAERQRATVALVCEDLLGCRWLRVEQCRASACTAAIRPLVSLPLGLRDDTGLVVGRSARPWSEAQP